MPTASCSRAATGARQFVVHDAFEIDVVLVRVVRLIEVHAEHDRRVGVLHRRGDDDLARAGFEMACRCSAGAKPSGRLDHDLGAESPQGISCGSERE